MVHGLPPLPSQREKQRLIAEKLSSKESDEERVIYSRKSISFSKKNISILSQSCKINDYKGSFLY